MESVHLPQKRYYRQRAHSNPIADHNFDYPLTPDHMNWAPLYPKYFGEDASKSNAKVEFADVGCGYGGLLVELSSLFPEALMLGLEIRVKVSDYVQERIKALRIQNPGKVNLAKCSFFFPDPHFKAKKHKWRIISPQLLSEYAYVLREGGIVYTITDVKELHEWMVKHLDEHPLFQKISDEELAKDLVIDKIFESSEEAKKVSRNKVPSRPRLSPVHEVLGAEGPRAAVGGIVIQLTAPPSLPQDGPGQDQQQLSH
ncbi:hypothetical protein TNCV_1077661 [Trichonephila clavipes]|uniref:tRNA (guanine-N(7)-)-methyltransferase n=1 Tax=Trichonephila clavipes TaxID=2585209 RepID=A0A8X6RVV3_TRICX|nr:hypothetical protein TNCV_1077661 [Trichonephila clavipes]